ncbi:diguanylate cyclase [Enterobacteriaceae bacterium RIT691]|nr:diguanylate cyclase [Enterobacteriaceae bacterium RIT691]
MHKLTIHPSKILREDNTFFNTIALIVASSVLYVLNSKMQPSGQMAVFWPMNAIMVGLFCRFSFFNKAYYYLILFISLIFWNGIQGSVSAGSTLIALSNVCSIMMLANSILFEREPASQILKINALRLYSYCLITALICSILGAYGFSLESQGQYWSIYPVWFSEQFSTSVLILPFLLTCNGRFLPQKFAFSQVMPVCLLLVTLVLSGCSGVVGSLSVTLPALIWCALSYTLPTTCLITLLAGGLEVLMVDTQWLHFGGNEHLIQIISARMGISSIAISPVIVAVSVQSINTLVKQLSARANYDYLTRVHSRFGLYEKLKIREQKSASTLLNVLLLDIDHFKTINDTHGHDCGDNVLSAFALRVKEIVGEQGIVARMGGEEFAVVLPDATDDNGFLLAEEIRADIEKMEVPWGGEHLTLTVSIGVSHGEAPHKEVVDAFDKLLSEADQYLYQSKNLGRNRTSAAPSVMTKHLAYTAH